MYYVKRTFHAVGQGAFFTEEFYNNNGLNCCVMYDCGSNTKGQPQKAVDYFMINHVHVDVLFISHFDSDHINGIKSLIKAHAIDENTYVVIPFKYPKLLIVFDQLIGSIIRSLISIKANLIGIIQISGDNISQGETIEINKNSKIRIGDRITLRGLGSWYYVPFMTHDNTNGSALEEFEKGIVERSKLDLDRLNDIEYVNDHLSVIKGIYNNTPKLSSSRTSKINMNSLLVLSYPSETNTVSLKSIWDEPHNYYWDFHYWVHPYHYLKSPKASSCLYTGDTGFDNISIFNDIMKRVHGYCQRPLGLLQIPHHGSINNYHQDIALRHRQDYLITFTNYDPRKKVFSNFVKHDLWFHQVPFITITDDSYTSFSQLIRVN